MPILACGINHKTAPVALREKVVFAQEKLPLFLNDLLTQENIQEAILLSTCNRSELYCSSTDRNKIIDWFCRQHALSQAELEPVMYFYQDANAVEHIMNVACGLDSMVLGESQILGQMKEAFSESCAAGSVGPLFNKLFQQVFNVAKQVRTNTAIGACPVSVSSAAVSFIKNRYPNPLDKATLLLVGAGTTVDLILRHLKNDDLKKVIIANRSLDNAANLAKKHRGEVINLSELPSALKISDIVITATGGTKPIITQAMMTSSTNSLLIIDIAVPRDVEPGIAELKNINLYSIDDLKEIIQKNLQGREHAAIKAREVIKQQSHEFMTWLNSFDMVGMTIRAYRKQIEDLCQLELAKAIRQIQRGEDPLRVITEFTQTLTNKLLHSPSVQLRQAGYEGRLEILQLAQQLFAISEPKAQTFMS